ncbi:MAG: dTMP kinase [Gammaproteobacteria bacterium]|nr:MAG: dTMP kinase [Gammaproteobacteria bacterium]
MKGCLITLEGGEGAGKSSALSVLRDGLNARGISPILTREPGGTRMGEAIRSLVLDRELGPVAAECELLLMFAARAQLVQEVILPALERGEWVLSDRFTDASFAYQGAGRGQPLERIAALEAWATQGIRPDLTLLLDLPSAAGLARAGLRSEPDRIEREDLGFFDRVRAGYRARAAAEPARFRVIDAAGDIESVSRQLRAALAAFLSQRGLD